ncbi:MAG: SLC13 family permease [Candidatus Hodarchaeota archaeon]
MSFPFISFIMQDIPFLGVGILLTAIFFIVLIVIASEKIDKVSVTLLGVLITLIIAVLAKMIENYNVLYQWIDIELIMTIVGITLIMEMLKKSGLLEVFILYILRSIRGSFDVLTLILALSVFILSMIITNVLALVIVASITVLIAEVAEFDPKPILFLELAIANLSGMLTPIASYTAAYVSLEQNWSYLDFLILSLPYVSIMILVTILFTRIMYQNAFIDLKMKEQAFSHQLQRLVKTIDPWGFVDSRNDFYKAIGIFFVVTVLLAIGTSLGVSIDIICLFGGFLVLIFFSDHVNEFIRAIDWPMLFFLCGIFIMSGLIQMTGLQLLLNEPVISLLELSPITGIVGFTWILGAFTSIIENIPLIFLLRPLIDLISAQTDSHLVWWAILAVVNITDSVVLISSVKGIYIMEMTNRKGMRISFIEYLRYGLIVTIIHLVGMAGYIFVLFTLS